MNDATDYTYCTVPQEKGSVKTPKWMRTYLVTDDNIVFFPAVSFCEEKACFLMATFDGIKVMRHAGHLYMPLNWLAEQFTNDANERYQLYELGVKLLVREIETRYAEQQV